MATRRRPTHDTVREVPWAGRLIGVQPRIRLTRSFDERSHTYQGYVLRVRGEIGGEERDFIVAIGEGAQAKHGFRGGDTVSGGASPSPIRVLRSPSCTGSVSSG